MVILEINYYWEYIVIVCRKEMFYNIYFYISILGFYLNRGKDVIWYYGKMWILVFSLSVNFFIYWM